jgi:methyltransferase (TIGR00027 family)
MELNESTINHVSDTALWVAYYRAKETKRADALFRDTLADRLIGERGKKIAESMPKIGKYTEWSVISRTVIIDQFILDMITDGVDTVLNLGAGLDTRPYRMNLPAELKWIEVDYAQIIAHKNKLLKSEKPKCHLIRVELDLADLEKRKKFLTEINSKSKKILVITEGVIPYLTEEQVALLANEIHQLPNMTNWILEFFKPEVYKYLKKTVRGNRMKNAPFQFYPPDWLGFFARHDWIPLDIQYSSTIATKTGRKIPMPWFAKIILFFASKAFKEKIGKMSGHMLLKKKS